MSFHWWHYLLLWSTKLMLFLGLLIVPFTCKAKHFFQNFITFEQTVVGASLVASEMHLLVTQECGDFLAEGSVWIRVGLPHGSVVYQNFFILGDMCKCWLTTLCTVFIASCMWDPMSFMRLIYQLIYSSFHCPSCGSAEQLTDFGYHS